MNKKIQFTKELLESSGKCDYAMTNDYLFRIIFQKNKRALLGLVSALLHRRPEEITSLEIMNPIEIGQSIAEKEMCLDLKIVLNHVERINLEMQIVDYKDWTERSLEYLCRMFDDVPRGGDYVSVAPAIHIGILDYTLFPEAPRFYSCNKLMDTETGHIYSDKFILNVLDLTKEELATQEDKEWQIDYWAKLFKATTWEDIRMIAENNEYMTEAANTMRDLYKDKILRDQCFEREMEVRRVRNYESRIRKQVEEQVREQVEEQIREQVEEQIREQVEEQIREQVEEQIRKQVKEQVEEQVEKRVREQLAEKNAEIDRLQSLLQQKQEEHNEL